MEDLKIIYLHPDQLTPYENNTRKHSPADIEAIKISILEDGFDDPIGIWGDQNVIVEGHGRQIAAKELHLDRVPCIRLDHLTDKQRREYAIRHNRTAELSQYDFDKLKEECARLSIEGQDFPELNFAFDLMDMDEPDDLDDESEKKRVVVSLNFKDFDSYAAVKDQLQDIADQNNALLAVKMA